MKKTLLFDKCNGRRPFFYIDKGNANYDGNELYINHSVERIPELFDIDKKMLTLDPADLEGVMKAMHIIGKKPVNIQTIDENGIDIVARYDGQNYTERILPVNQ